MRVNQGQCPANRCPVKSLIFAGHFTVKCLAWIQMSGKGLEVGQTKCPVRLKQILRTLTEQAGNFEQLS